MELVSSSKQYVIRLEQGSDKAGKLINCVNFKIVEPDLEDIEIDYEPVATGEFGYDGCIHFRAEYHHYCKAEDLIEVGDLLKQAQQIVFTTGVGTYKAVR